MRKVSQVTIPQRLPLILGSVFNADPGLVPMMAEQTYPTQRCSSRPKIQAFWLSAILMRTRTA